MFSNMAKIDKVFIVISLILSVAGCRENRPADQPSSAKLETTDKSITPSEPTVFPVEAWVVTARQTYRTGEMIDLRLHVKSRAEHTVRLPVPIVCVNGSGWGELRFDLFINGRRLSAECHTGDVVELESDSEISWPIRCPELQIPIGKTPWDTQGHFTVYAAWHELEISAQRNNDFLGPLVSHPAEFDILIGKVKHTCDGIDTPQQYAEFVKRIQKNLGRQPRATNEN